MVRADETWLDEQPALREWLAYHRRAGHAKNSLRRYTRTTRQFVLFLHNRDITTITVRDLEQYVDVLLKERNPNTVNQHIQVFKSFFSWYSSRYHVPNVLAEFRKTKGIDPDQRCLTEDEYQAVLRVCDQEECDIIQLLGNTGLRRDEYVRLRHDDIAADLKSLRVLGKGAKRRTIPLNGVCQSILTKDWDAQHNEFTFHRRCRGKSALNRLCNRLARRAMIPLFGPHALRHFFATRLFKAGVPAKVISKILGHSSLAITEMVYCHLLPSDLLGATDMLCQ